MEKHFIDDLARKALDNMEVPYQPDDWDLMEARLDKERKLQGQLIFFKGVEVSLVLLALWTIFQFMPSTIPGNSNPVNSDEPSVILPAEMDNNDEKAIKALEDIDETPPIEEETAPLNQTQNGKLVADAASKQGQQSDLTQHREEAVSQVDQQPEDPLPPDIRFEQPIEFDITNQNEIAYNETSTLESSNTTENTSTTELTRERSVLSTAMLPSMAPFTLEETLRFTYSPIGGDPIPDPVRRPKRLSVIFSPDMNGMSNNLSMGFSFGGLIAKELTDNWDFESGLIYSYKPFDYLATDDNGNPIEENAVQDVQLHLAEVPFMMHYSFNKSVNWRSYATFGVSTFFVAHADYNKGNIELPIVVENNSDKGLMQGGRFASNFYLTANLGFGLERKLSKNTSLFVQPTFRYPLMKMGPYEDKLGTFSLAMGARAML